MSITTKTGDDGETGLLFSRRTGKDDPRVAACGDVDEFVEKRWGGSKVISASAGLSLIHI